MMTDTTRWTVSVSKDTDIAVRSFLAQRGMKKGDLSKFIEEAVKWRVLDQIMVEARGKFADMTPEGRWCTSRGRARWPNPKLLCGDRLATDGIRATGHQHPV
jgi:hypothetical protein